VLDCGNSGTTARLMLGLLAGRALPAELTGDDSLRSRPMARVTEPLAAMGAEFEFLAERGRLPLRVRGGALRALEHRSPRASAQVKSAVLLAGLVAGVPVRVSEPALSRDHTERMLRFLGAGIESGADGHGAWAALVPSGEPLATLDLTVPGDPSSAAFLIALAALGGADELRVPDVCVNPTRAGFVDVMRRMGVRIGLDAERLAHGEPVADLVAGPAALRAAEIGGTGIAACIDEIPILAVLAARAEGVTRITGAEELRVKESDRITALVSNLRAVGVRAEELPDGLEVEGTEAPLAGRVVTHHDHRIAMAFGVLGALPGNRIEIDDPACVDVSFPGSGTCCAASRTVRDPVGLPPTRRGLDINHRSPITDNR
jgi:3-phosphoshikimate 1-carboxyvinyltransferase